MLSGRRLDLLNPSPLDIEISDIAHGLARVARWNGQTQGPHAFSVAQHSVVVEEIAFRIQPKIPPAWRLAALLHDAPEYVVGDMISPFKAALGFDYKSFELQLLEAIHLRFGLPAHLPDAALQLIKRADKACAYLEAIELAGFSHSEAARYFGRPPKVSAAAIGVASPLTPLTADEACELYLGRFVQLTVLAGLDD
ncbi:hypothetical protein FHS85_001370 [Rhodoligotrophos appendicifer]|uniref:HD family hydrolase n=1 Tax=Rhodoligotrophos appendicifer TaxID=987056 RepID=UPI00319DAD97